MYGTNKERLQLRLPPAMRQALVEMAARYHVGVSDIVRASIERTLQENRVPINTTHYHGEPLPFDFAAPTTSTPEGK